MNRSLEEEDEANPELGHTDGLLIPLGNADESNELSNTSSDDASSRSSRLDNEINDENVVSVSTDEDSTIDKVIEKQVDGAEERKGNSSKAKKQWKQLSQSLNDGKLAKDVERSPSRTRSTAKPDHGKKLSKSLKEEQVEERKGDSTKAKKQWKQLSQSLNDGKSAKDVQRSQSRTRSTEKPDHWKKLSKTLKEEQVDGRY